MHFSQLQFLLPQRLLCQIFGWLAERSHPLIRRPMIGVFRFIYRIDMGECEIKSPSEYQCFNEFFTRRLNPESRPVAPGKDVVVSPVDGTFSCVGTVEQGLLLQAKSRQFSLLELLAILPGSQKYEGAKFATIYLAPANYHRVHIPIDSELETLVYVPGRQFSVNCTSTRHIPDIYARNERLIAEFSSPSGNYCLVMVGALLVAGMLTVVTGPIGRRPEAVSLAIPKGRKFVRGEEFGAFQMGSTVILLFPQEGLGWNETAREGENIRFGEIIGSLDEVQN